MKRLFFIGCLTASFFSIENAKAQQFNNTIMAAKAGLYTQEVESCWTPSQGFIDVNETMLSRVEIRNEPAQANEPYAKLSTIGLRNKCNANMQRDETNFNPNTFNPLKYFLNFTVGVSTTYRVDNTSYVIVIH